MTSKTGLTNATTCHVMRWLRVVATWIDEEGTHTECANPQRHTIHHRTTKQNRKTIPNTKWSGIRRINHKTENTDNNEVI